MMYSVSAVFSTYSGNYKGFTIFLQAIIFLIMCSTVPSLPLYRKPISDKYVKSLEIDNWNETDASASLNATNYSTSKRRLLSVSEDTHSYPQNAKVLGQGSRIRKSKSGAKRGLNIGLNIRLASTPKYNKELDKLEEVLEIAKLNLGNKLEKVLNVSGCPTCDEEQPFVPEKLILKPAYECDEWNAQYRLCTLERNVGDTVTFYLSTGKFETMKPKVTWKKEFHMRDSKSRTGFLIEPDNTPENIIIGKQGYELRISPITETDIGYNVFSASLNGYHQSTQSTVYFMIRIVPIDLGFVYVGETIELNLRSHLSFPAQSFSFRWYMEKYGEHSTLPSNMRTSFSGSSIKISELRQEQEGILACSIYTNRNFLATRMRFLMKDLVKNNDVLKSPPNHTLHFEEKNSDRRRRFPKILIRNKRDINVEDFEKTLMGLATEKTWTTASRKPVTTTHSYDDYNIGMDFGYPATTVKIPENLRVILNNGGYGEKPVQPVDVSVEDNPLGIEDTIKRQIMDRHQDQIVNEIYGDPDRRWRFPNMFIRNKRDISAEDFEKALMGLVTEETRTTTSRKPHTSTHSYDDYNVGMDFGYPASTVKPSENLRGILSNGGYREAPAHPVDISAEDNPVGIEETGVNRQFMDTYQDQIANRMYDGAPVLNSLPMGKNLNQFNQHSSEQDLNVVNKIAPLQNGLDGNPELAAVQQASLPNNIYKGGKNILDIQVQNAGGINDTSSENSDIILNIEKIRGPRQITAEEKISKLISLCFGDYECSGMGYCIRSNLKQPGHCKCMAGFYGVGIFCREDVWVSNNNFGLQDLQHPDEVPYPSSLPMMEKRDNLT